MNDDNEKSGSPAWMTTFADLMTLLMCFFILLLSFSELDVLKFKQLAGTMEYAFGVQNRIEILDQPQGTSFIFTEFSPGRPDPSPLETIMQHTIDSNQSTSANQQEQNESQQTSDDVMEEQHSLDAVVVDSNIQEMKDRLLSSEQLNHFSKGGGVEVEGLGQQLVIRIMEEGTFAKGSSFLQPQFIPIIEEIVDFLVDYPGLILVTGYTDVDEFFEKEIYSSYWDLSLKRALSVADVFIDSPSFNESRLIVRGLASGHFIFEQKTVDVENKSTKIDSVKKRRVEIMIMQGRADYTDPISIQDLLNN